MASIIILCAAYGAAGQDFFPLQVVQQDNSVKIIHQRTKIRTGPSGKNKMRGMAEKGSLLPLLETSEGEGCSGHQWYRVHEKGWVCGRDVEVSDQLPLAMNFPVTDHGGITPWPYAFIKENAIEYKWSRLGWLEEIREIFKGFGFAVEATVEVDGTRYLRTPEGKLIPKYAARYTSRVSDYGGRDFANGEPWPVGWVNSEKAWVYSEPVISKGRRARQLERYDSFVVYEKKGNGKKAFYRIGEGFWIPAREVRVTTETEKPAAVGVDEKWIDVDVDQQIITAYRGSTPVHSALVSTGRWGASATEKGEFRIWVKVAAIAMDNTDEEEEVDTAAAPADTDTSAAERHLYSLQDVPWTQFFHENYAMHAVYWHNGFGNRKSHGCVNLAPRDAKWFYDWTEPRVPAGWWSIYTAADEKSTLVKVR